VRKATRTADDIELARQSRLLRMALRPLLLVGALGMPMVWIPGFTTAPVLGFFMSLSFAGVLLAIDRLGRGNRTFLASLLFLLLVHATFFVAFAIFGGLGGPYIAAFPVLACVAGLVLGRRAALLSSVSSAAVLAGAFALERLAVPLPTVSPPMPLTNAMIVTLLTGLLTYTLWVALGELELAREEWEALERERRAAHRLESVGRLAGGVAHDFNNLLTVILANSDLEQIDPRDPTLVRRSIEEIHAAGQRAHGLTQQLLAFARQQVLEPRLLDLNQLVADLRTILRRLLRANIELAVELTPELPWVRADPGKLEQVVVNLVVNAQDAMPSGGHLTLETRKLVLDPGTSGPHPSLEAGLYAALIVSDTGTGIPPEMMDRVFDPFFSTRTDRGGTGLGLSTVQGIVAQSGGAVLVLSEVGKGSTFEVYLPAQPPTTVDSPPQTPTDRTDSGATLGLGRVVLVADDDSAVRGVTARMLQALGFRVLEAESAEQAQELEAKSPLAIDVLVTDVVMTGMGGLALAKAMQARRPELKVLFISGYSEEAVRNEGALRPGTRFMPKPFGLADLERHLRTLLDRAA
jgi:signal transduction histidine kinase